jgi:hypothetical protein
LAYREDGTQKEELFLIGRKNHGQEGTE